MEWNRGGNIKITGELKNKIDSLWEMFWTGGLTNPLDVNDNDIPDIIERFRNRNAEADRKRTDKSFLVPKQEIVDNGYDLSINKYKEVEYIPIEYPPASEIIEKIEELEMQIAKEFQELKAMLQSDGEQEEKG